MKIEGTSNNFTEVGSSLSTVSKESVSAKNVQKSVRKNVEKVTPIKQTATLKKKDHISELANQTDAITEEQEQKVVQAIEQANKQFRTYDRRLEFSIHEATKEIMVKVINTEDDAVIREIPSEKVLDMVAKMWEVAGILVDEKI